MTIEQTQMTAMCAVSRNLSNTNATSELTKLTNSISLFAGDTNLAASTLKARRTVKLLHYAVVIDATVEKKHKDISQKISEPKGYKYTPSVRISLL